MAITLTGVDGSVTEAAWSQLHELALRGAWNEVVNPGGLVASVATGTRLISVGPGAAFAAGVRASSSLAETVTLDENAGSDVRIDYIVLEIDWGTDVADVKFVKGTAAANPVAPALTKTAGVLWQIPLARVTVRPGVGQIAASDLERCEPKPRHIRLHGASIPGGVTVAANATSPKTVASVAVPDPGWPHRVRITSQVNFRAADSGHGHVLFTLDGPEVHGAPAWENGTAQGSWLSGILAGPHEVRVRMKAVGMATGDGPLETVASSGQFQVEVIPAQESN